MSKIGQLLIAHRERLGMSQGELAKAAGLSRGVISETESGDIPKLSTLVQFRDGLGLSKKQWHRFLAIYLVESGAVGDQCPPKLPDPPPDADARTLALHALRLQLDKLPVERLDFYLGLAQTLVSHPYLFPAVEALLKFAKATEPPKGKS